MDLTEQEIIQICRERVDISRLTAKNFSLCIDGTSCTKKTSILNITGRMVSKNQHLNPNQNSDTFFPSMIGYITSSIGNLSCGGPHYEDRSPLNVLDWHILWKIYDDYVKRFGNSEPSIYNVDMVNALDTYRTIFRTYKEWYIYKMFANDINTIALIDSDVYRCDSLRYARNLSTDRERSLWKFYTPLQNLMYMELYPKTHIDLNWFGNAAVNDVVSGIAKFLNSVLDQLSQQPNLTNAPLVDRRLPTVKADYNLENITTHVYRSIGRHGCRLILGGDEQLNARVPKYLTVDNICEPMGGRLESIIAATRHYLLQTNNVVPTIDDNGEDITEKECDVSEMF